MKKVLCRIFLWYFFILIFLSCGFIDKEKKVISVEIKNESKIYELKPLLLSLIQEELLEMGYIISSNAKLKLDLVIKEYKLEPYYVNDLTGEVDMYKQEGRIELELRKDQKLQDKLEIKESLLVSSLEEASYSHLVKKLNEKICSSLLFLIE
jgi:hypothetical protein